MNVTVQIPDDLAKRLSGAGGDLSRRALEGFALEEYKSGRLTKPELRQLLGCETPAALDGFLKAHAVLEDLPTAAELERERRDAARLHSGGEESVSIAYLQKTNPKEWARQFDAWVDSHDPNAPVLSDEAMGRESIYPDRI